MDSQCKRPYINLQTVRVNIKWRAVRAFTLLLPHRLETKVLSPVPHAPQRMHGSQARPDASFVAGCTLPTGPTVSISWRQVTAMATAMVGQRPLLSP